MSDIDIVLRVTSLSVPQVRVQQAGLVGPPGPIGPPGPAGGGGGAGGSFFRHTQTTPSALWTITHNLGYFANVNVVDSQNNQVEGDVKYISHNVITVTFSAAFAGEAFVS